MSCRIEGEDVKLEMRYMEGGLAHKKGHTRSRLYTRFNKGLRARFGFVKGGRKRKAQDARKAKRC